jgi:hypothetical protein
MPVYNRKGLQICKPFPVFINTDILLLCIGFPDHGMMKIMRQVQKTVFHTFNIGCKDIKFLRIIKRLFRKE